MLMALVGLTDYLLLWNKWVHLFPQLESMNLNDRTSVTRVSVLLVL